MARTSNANKSNNNNGPAKAANGSPSKRKQPGKTVRIKKEKKEPDKLIAVAKIAQIEGCIQIVWFEKHTNPDQDGFNWPLAKAINNQEQIIKDLGFYACLPRRQSFLIDAAVTNAEDKWWRKVFVRLVNEEDDNHEARIQFLTKLTEWMKNSPDNKLSTQFLLLPETADMTKTNNLDKLDHWIRTNDIIEFIRDNYENVGDTWAAQNKEDAVLYFTGPNYPLAAKENLGYRML